MEPAVAVDIPVVVYIPVADDGPGVDHASLADAAGGTFVRCSLGQYARQVEDPGRVLIV